MSASATRDDLAVVHGALTEEGKKQRAASFRLSERGLRESAAHARGLADAYGISADMISKYVSLP